MFNSGSSSDSLSLLFWSSSSNMYCIDMLSICLVQDFMSFVAHSLGYYSFHPERVAYHRSILINEIRTHTDEYWNENQWHAIFRCIILTTCPVYPTDNQYQLSLQYRIDIESYFKSRVFMFSEKTIENYAKSTDIRKFILYSLTLSNFNSIMQLEKRLLVKLIQIIKNLTSI